MHRVQEAARMLAGTGTSLPHCHSSPRPLCFLSWDGRGEQQCMHFPLKNNYVSFSLEENGHNNLICYLVGYL